MKPNLMILLAVAALTTGCKGVTTPVVFPESDTDTDADSDTDADADTDTDTDSDADTDTENCEDDSDEPVLDTDEVEGFETIEGQESGNVTTEDLQLTVESDSDYFKIQHNQSSDKTVTVGFAHDEGNIDVEVSSVAIIDGITTYTREPSLDGVSTDDDEVLLFPASLASGQYVFRVFRANPGCQTYSLNIVTD